MAWIRVDQSLGNHRKTRRLADELGVDRATAVGHLVLLWSWVLDNAPTGALKGIATRDLADAACKNGDPETFVQALINAGFIDRKGRGGTGLYIHDWYEYAGKLCETRAANKERMRRARAGATKSTKSTKSTNEENDLPPYSPPKGGHGRGKKNAFDRYRRIRNPDEPLSGPYHDKVNH
jgi:hypothetical protein